MDFPVSPGLELGYKNLDFGSTSDVVTKLEGREPRENI